MERRKRRISKSSEAEVSKHAKSLANTDSSLIRNAFYVSSFVRLSAVIFTQSYFVPDEYWQSTEVAHNQVFGVGYICWEWKEKIRSYLYPFLFELYFRILNSLRLDYKDLISYGPHFIQAIFSILGDLSLLSFTRKLFKCEKISELTFYIQLSSWFVYYTCSRTLSDTMAMCLVSFALYFLPFNMVSDLDSNSKSEENGRTFQFSAFFFFVGLSCVVRPHVIVLWIPLVISLLFQKSYSFINIFFAGLKMVVIVLIIQLGIDYYFYEKLTFSHWNFLTFNVVRKGNMLFGTHPFHWYITQGLPVAAGFNICFLLYGLIKCQERSFIYSAAIFIVVLSWIPHKEFRFVLPLLPFITPYCGYGLFQVTEVISSSKKKLLLALLLMVNIFAAMFFCMVHQRGSIDLIRHVGDLSQKQPNSSVLFLMPCHSTPYYSYVHNNISMKFLTCHPSFDKDYVSEVDMFFRNPKRWLESSQVLHNYTHIACFDNLKRIEEKIFNNGFKKVKTFFHTYLPEGRISRYIIVYEKVL